MLRQGRRALDPDYAVYVPGADKPTPGQDALGAFYDARSRLMQAVARGGAADAAPVQPAWPPIDACRTRKQLLKTLLAASPGLVVAATPASRASKRLLIEKMPLLFNLGVRTLYVQPLQHDLHQADLDLLHATGTLPPALGSFLDELDGWQMTDRAANATYREVVAAASRAGLRIVALDLMASAHLKGVESGVGTPASPVETRARVGSHVAVKRIEHDQGQRAGAPGPSGWVALVDTTHAGTFNGIAGIAARLGIPSLRVEDVHDANAPRLEAGIDPGLSVPAPTLRAQGHLRCDYLLNVRSPT
ncbi:MAG: membrane-targeted effector domain-containing toxin [Stenotrophomonas sp.]